MTGGHQPNAARVEAIEKGQPPMSTVQADVTVGLLAEFAERAGALGVAVDRLATSEAVAAAIKRVLDDVGASRLVIADELAQAAPRLTAALRRAGTSWAPPSDAAALQHEPLGASLGHLAIAETGSVLLAETGLPDRAIGMLVAVQVILCRSGAIVPSLDDAAPVLRDLALRPGGAYATLVTGPSRTADIERVLTVGVQGPGRVMIFFVDELT